jgi:DNA-binding beta-propeller fold protein YncE
MLAVAVVALLRVARMRHLAMAVLLCGLSIALTGCNKTLPKEAEVLDHFGRTGRGQCQFVYPRAIDITADGSLYVVDKTGRIQHLTDEGDFLSVIPMPEVDAGQPTGVTVGPDGNIYVADTHYYRVVAFSPTGETLFEFGRYGTEEGCFIFPTDVAFAPDGRIFVSEYGGNDRISVFTETGEFLSAFGAPGSGQGQFSRPAALCVDESRRLLYVADACNHRIAVYDLQGKLIRYIGSAGLDRGHLRYPYDLALRDDGTIIVCEYGNNRIQSFDPAGNSLGICGGAGRQLGQLAYPWGVAVGRDRAYIVDAGNDRIQVWGL